MRAHRVDTFLIRENVRLEIIHESNSYFGGEHISIAFRFKHLGSQHDFFNLKEQLCTLDKTVEEKLQQQASLQENEESNAENKTWSMKSLLGAFRKTSNTDDATDVQNMEMLNKNRVLREKIQKQLHFHQPLSLISGYVQISGVFQYDSEVIAQSKFKQNEIKMVGLDILSGHGTKYVAASEDGDRLKGNRNLTKYFNSDFSNVTNGLLSPEITSTGAISSYSEPVLVNSNDTSIRVLPLLLIPQTLLFSEISLEPGEVRTFYFKSTKLPKDICPSYSSSKIVSINYTLEVGVDVLSDDNIKPFSNKVPIVIAPYISPNAEQYTSHFDKPPIILKAGNIKELKPRPFTRKVSTASAISFGRRKSSIIGPPLEDNKSVDRIKKSFIELVESNQSGSRDIDELVDLQMEVQFGKDEDSSDPEPNDSRFSNEMAISADSSTASNSITKRRKSESVRNNISNLGQQAWNDVSLVKTDNNSNILPQLVNLQNAYQINRNNESMAKVSLSAPFFKTTDDIDMVIELDSITTPLLKVTSLTVSLESFEIVNPKYKTEGKRMGSKPKGNAVYEKHFICFDECKSVSVKLLPPRSPTSQITGQFKTDVFQHKWMIGLKFAIVAKTNNITLNQFYEDKKGVLFHSKETLEGEEFSCYVPVPILASSEDFMGW
ncbi:Rgp1p [Saccharomyces eubayanus]|uniref:Rgp1p n=1 Tax=Saccharomyces eubayanus TaxID=1080349 RepID=UPI0006BEFA2F|nr:RGP1-like protein [Saccharomyces eubayanus]KOH00983.1 RGP1-like protein [Saccharomyces eubayanus]